ncbi:hypothetical protein BJF85_00235 [Saccharomonospora sp. CUA-673]|uniref:hypothetical protein n=1 Tax=Saccharomonospora sp. CUA-673 TaxID=1904969 RepID=UPI00095C0A13|nr:hypothetical protein [Saccharomonospora sp. CUA-673]OLT46938.1 hypothetical protein BJF85_00235 [Saccharomonospora sp. CUA-673]
MWTQYADGLVTVGPDGWPIEADPDTPDLDTVPGWRPVSGGVRHIGGTVDEPAVGTAAEMLCGWLVDVPRRRRREQPALFDCSACWHEWLGVDE